jgi:t-SNARE complex subunit (syntaxin)
MLNQVEDQLDTTANRMQEGLKRMKDFIKANSDTKQQFTIIGLVVLLIVLVILVIIL